VRRHTPTNPDTKNVCSVFVPQTFRQFNKERSSDKCKGFDVDKILEQISDLIGR
jgi:hypothetical protein